MEFKIIYWIIRGRHRVKFILRKSVACKLIQGKIAVPTETPVLPSCWISCYCAFQKIGLDFGGPLHRKDDFFRPKICSNAIFYFCGLFRTTEATICRCSSK